MVAFDKYGELLYNDTVHASVTDLGVFGEYLFLQTETGVIRLNAKTEEEEELYSGSGKMLLYNVNTAVVCGESKAQYLIFSD